MRRRRKSAGSWFPILPTYYGESNTGVTWTESTLTVPQNPQPGDTHIQAIPLTFDGTKSVNQTEPVAQSNSLLDFVQGQDYVAKRIVGNVWFNHPGFDGDTVPGGPTRSVCCITLAVLPVGDDGSIAMDAEDFNPFFAANSQQPWLWRRCWQLADSSKYFLPATTNWYGSIKEGGFLDTKGTSRRITKEQRLFLIAAAGILDVDTEGPSEANTQFVFGYDLRLFGSMRSSRNRSTFK